MYLLHTVVSKVYSCLLPCYDVPCRVFEGAIWYEEVPDVTESNFELKSPTIKRKDAFAAQSFFKLLMVSLISVYNWSSSTGSFFYSFCCRCVYVNDGNTLFDSTADSQFGVIAKVYFVSFLGLILRFIPFISWLCEWCLIFPVVHSFLLEIKLILACAFLFGIEKESCVKTKIYSKFFRYLTRTTKNWGLWLLQLRL